MSEPRVNAPIVLVHGILGFNKLVLIGPYFRGIRDALLEAGNNVPEPPQLNTAGSIDERADDLERYLTNPANTGVYEKSVHVIAHSMGGLDSRRLISRNHQAMSKRVLSLTTLGTPHRGTPFADLGTETFRLVLDALIGLGINVKGFFDLTTAKADQFNQENPDASSVRYCSIAGAFNPKLTDVLKIPHDIINNAGGGLNDGLVPVSSATYGTFLGTWPGDHFRLINQGTNLIPTPSEMLDSTIISNYLDIVRTLSEAGF
jgi:triacylglycerol lipase